MRRIWYINIFLISALIVLIASSHNPNQNPIAEALFGGFAVTGLVWLFNRTDSMIDESVLRRSEFIEDEEYGNE